jgi:hypothetical protein
MKRMKLFLTLALPVVLLQDVQAQSSRLIAQANWFNNGTVFVRQDTTSYSYTNPRGGDLKQPMLFDNAFNWGVADTALINRNWTIQEFYSDNTLKASTLQTWNALSGAWQNSTRVNYWYTSGGMVDYSIAQTWGGASWTNVSRNVYTYGSGKLVRNEMQTWNGVTFTPTSAKIYSYDAAGNTTQILSQSYESGIWVYTDLWEYTYTSMSWLSTEKYSVWSTSSFRPRTMNSYSYDTSGNMLTKNSQKYNATTTTYDNSMLSTFSNFTSGRMAQTQIDESWDSTTSTYNYMKEYTYTYNTFGQLTSSTGISWNRAGFWQYVLGDPKMAYYYQTYTVGVNSIDAVKGSMNVYPVPAQNVVNIALSWADAQAFQVVIYGMDGSLVNTWQVEPTAQYNVSVPVGNLATGNYLVKVVGSKGQLTQQFSVAH